LEHALTSSIRSELGTSVPESVEDLALLEAAMHSGRDIAGGITHDLNAALQGLGDALFAIREDLQCAADNRPNGTGMPIGALASSLRLADDSLQRLTEITRTIPNLVPQLADESGPISLGTELLSLVALTWHHWRNRVHVLVEVEPSVGAFWCTWWIARLAALRMLLDVIDAHRPTEAAYSRRELSRIRFIAAMRGDEIELRVSSEPSNENAADGRSIGKRDEPDPIVMLCARRLGGTVRVTNDSGCAETAIRFPVRRSPPPNVMAVL
jgi:hypothetical protein